MNLKPIIRLQFRYDYRVFRIMYLIVYATVALNMIYELSSGGGQVRMHTSGLELATIITIFIVGLHSFRRFFLFYSANGVSRRRVFAGVTASLAIAAACTALIDTANAAIFSLFMDYRPMYATRLHDLASFSMTKGPSFHASLSASLLAKNLLWCFCAYLACALFGLCLSMLYYRMNRIQKLAFSAGVPIFLLVFLPVVDQNITGGQITAALVSGFRWWIACSMNPASDLAAHLILSVLLSGAAFLLIRRVEIRQ